ncbi:hypothetical protein DY000_02032187 [Brassica cretica]|uniref:Uncharacterized protein n=1 Tax=Brassica cretica TaxID=69181 RepID=A0ABQ7DWM8_BRACR|nr:hypothetical protein DY000_02032187 [Brassica cretica]
MKGSFLKLIDFVWKHGEVWSYGGGERGRAGGGTVEVDQKSKGKYKVTVEELMAEMELLEVDIKVVVMKEVVSGHGGSGGVVSGHGSVEGLVVVVGCVLLWFHDHIFSALL